MRSSNSTRKRRSPLMELCISQQRKLLAKVISCRWFTTKTTWLAPSISSRWWRSTRIVKISYSHQLRECMEIRITAKRLIRPTPLVRMDKVRCALRCYWVHSPRFMTTGGSYLWDISIPVGLMIVGCLEMSHQFTPTIFFPIFRRLLLEKGPNWTFLVMTTQLLTEPAWGITFISWI